VWCYLVLTEAVSGNSLKPVRNCSKQTRFPMYKAKFTVKPGKLRSKYPWRGERETGTTVLKRPFRLSPTADAYGNTKAKMHLETYCSSMHQPPTEDAYEGSILHWRRGYSFLRRLSPEQRPGAAVNASERGKIHLPLVKARQPTVSLVCLSVCVFRWSA